MGYKKDLKEFVDCRLFINSHRNVNYEGNLLFSDDESVVLYNVSVYEANEPTLCARKDFFQIERDDILDMYVIQPETRGVLNVGEGWIVVGSQRSGRRSVTEEKSSQYVDEWKFAVPNKPPPRYLHDDKRYQIPDDVKRIIQTGLKKWHSMTNSQLETLNRVNKLLQEGLNAINYKNYFYFLLFVEEFDLEVSIAKCSMKVNIKKDINGGFSFEAQSILDKSPDLVVGDKIYLTKTKCKYNAFINKIQGPEVFAAVQDWKEHMDKIFGNNDTTSVLITFTLNKYLLFCKQTAILNLPKPTIRELFPTEKMIPNQGVIIPKLKLEALIDKSVYNNDQQLQAVGHILKKTSGTSPYILFGPPGTGKTATLVEAVKQVYFQKKKSRIVVTAPSNPATNLLALRLLQHIPQAKLVRIFASSHEETHEIPWDLNPITEIGFQFLENKPLEQRVVCLTLSMCPHLPKHQFKASHVFIDEAAQMTEPDMILALSGIMKDDGQITLSGDPHQLGPVVKSNLAVKLGLTLSPLERLMQTPVYSKDPVKGYNPLVITKLLVNYRSHPALLEISNRLFYDGELISDPIPHVQKSTLTEKIKWLPSANFPLIFHHVESKFEMDHPSKSIYNPAEAEVVLRYVKDFQGEGVKPHDIGVITPYRSQCRNIQKKLKDEKMSDDILVGSTEEFQGQERQVMILSLCRSSIGPSGQISDELGFLTCRKRFNVSLTRAKLVQIVIGDESLLSQNKLWNEVIQACRSNGTMIGSKNKMIVNLATMIKKKQKKRR